MSEQDAGLLTGTADNPAPAADAGNWKDGVAKELRFSADGNDKLSKFDDPTAMATSYIELQNHSSSMVKMPGEDAEADEVSAFYQKLGKPETVEGYTLPDLAEGEAYDPIMMDAVKNYAFEKHMSNDHLKGIIEVYHEQAEAAQIREAEATTESLQKDWNTNYDGNIEVSRRALRELVPEDMRDSFVETLTRHNLDNNETFIRAFHAIGKQMLDDTIVKGDPAKPKEEFIPSSPNSPDMYARGDDEASAKAREYFRGKGHVYTRKD